MKAKLLLILCFLITGCTTTKTVYVPSPCVKPKLPREIHYPIKDIKQGDKPDKVAKAWVATAQAQNDWIQAVKAQNS